MPTYYGLEAALGQDRHPVICITRSLLKAGVSGSDLDSETSSQTYFNGKYPNKSISKTLL